MDTNNALPDACKGLISTLSELRDRGRERDRLADLECLVRQNLAEDEAGLRAVNRRQDVLRDFEAQMTGLRADRDSLLDTQKRLESEVREIVGEVDRFKASDEHTDQQKHEQLKNARKEKQGKLLHAEEMLFARCAEIEELEKHMRTEIITQRSACRAILQEAVEQRDSAKLPIRQIVDYLRRQLELVGRLHGELSAQMVEEECALQDVRRLAKAAYSSATVGAGLARTHPLAPEDKLDIEAVRARCAELGKAVEEARRARDVDRWRRVREEERIARRGLERLESTQARQRSAAATSGGVTDWEAMKGMAEVRVKAARGKWLGTLEIAMREWEEWARAQEQLKQTRMEVVEYSKAALEEEMFAECLVCSAFKVLATIEFRNRKIGEEHEALAQLAAQQKDSVGDINKCLRRLEGLQAALVQAE